MQRTAGNVAKELLPCLASKITAISLFDEIVADDQREVCSSKMHALLIHNPTAGIGNHTVETLSAFL